MLSNMRQWFRFTWPAFIGLAAALVLWFAIPLPYIVYEPGPAFDTGPMVSSGALHAEGDGAAAEEGGTEGAFLLTTVSWSYANLFKYALALVNPHAELLVRETVTRGDDRNEYAQRQQLQMRASHWKAIEAVYRELGVPYRSDDVQLIVMSVLDGLSADGVLLPGDRLLSIDGMELAGEGDVAAAMQPKQIGDKVVVEFLRSIDGKEEKREATLELKALPDTDPPRPGMGITYGAFLSVASDDPAYRADIRAGSIGGPSAGLMFALELYDRFTPEDWTRGYQVAGTGDIAPDGTVHAIGGVAQKVVGAHRRGADIFFVPPANAEDAIEKAKAIGTNMTVVPVASLREALDYLAALPPKRP